jgi:2-dehydro-3-deoxyphosphogalactonate aldolase
MDPDLAAERASAYAEQGFTALKFDPLGPYSAFDPRQPSLEALARSETYVARVREPSAIAATCSSARTVSSPPAGAVRLGAAPRAFRPALGSRSPFRPKAPREMAIVARATRFRCHR